MIFHTQCPTFNKKIIRHTRRQQQMEQNEVERDKIEILR